jgi:hypothetical protein
MKSILSAFAVLGVLATAPGCKSQGDKIIDNMKGFRDRMCACKDKQCGEQVSKDEHDYKQSVMKDTKPEEIEKLGDQLKRDGKEIIEAERACEDKLK